MSVPAQWEGQARRFMLAAVGFFVPVAAVGIILRAAYAGTTVLPFGFGNLINAHSHLAFFGWVSMGIMGGIYYLLEGSPGAFLRERPGLRELHFWLTVVAVVGAFGSFAAGGYSGASIAFSTANQLLWYLFVFLTARALMHHARYGAASGRKTGSGTRGQAWVQAGASLLLAAEVYLVLATAGTWAVTYLAISGGNDPFRLDLAVSFFLHNFSQGWFVLGVMGLVYSLAGRSLSPGQGRVPEPWQPRLQLYLQTMAILPAFLVAAGPETVAMLPAPLRVIGSAATVLLLVPYGIFLVNLTRLIGLPALRGASPATVIFWQAARFFLVIAGLALAIQAVPSLGRLRNEHQLVIAYLHILLLGLVSSALAGAIYACFPGTPTRGWAVLGHWWLFVVGTGGMILVLLGVGLLGLVPPIGPLFAWLGRGVGPFQLAFWFSLFLLPANLTFLANVGRAAMVRPVHR